MITPHVAPDSDWSRSKELRFTFLPPATKSDAREILINLLLHLACSFQHRLEKLFHAPVNVFFGNWSCLAKRVKVSFPYNFVDFFLFMGPHAREVRNFNQKLNFAQF